MITAIELGLRTGGSFPEGGYTTKIMLRACTVTGRVIEEVSATVQDSPTGSQPFVAFSFSEPISTSVGERYVIEWESPLEGGVIFTWMSATSDTYPDGIAYGCTGNPNPEKDFIFRVLPLED
jgi:hypothetical protein